MPDPLPPCVLLASVLKPVDDPRMRGKFAETIGQLGLLVHVAGRAEANTEWAAASADERVTLHRIFRGGRLSLDRLAAQTRYWRLLGRLRPALVVVHAPELLPLTLLWRALTGRPFLYDVRENYALNVRSQGVYGRGVGRALAVGLRLVEGWAARRAAAVLLAEASYAAELPWLRAVPPGRVLVLENKYQPAPGEVLPPGPRPAPAPTEPLRLLFSGTLSELNGVREALALAAALHRAWPGGARLTLIGFCQRPALLADLQSAVARLNAAAPELARLVGGAGPVAHAEIVAEIGRAHLGLLPYRPHPSTWRCRPTKLFEYLAHGLPVLMPANPLWTALVAAHGAGLVVDFAAPEATAARLARALPGRIFYSEGPPLTEVLWQAEGEKLGHLLRALRPALTFTAPMP